MFIVSNSYQLVQDFVNPQSVQTKPYIIPPVLHCNWFVTAFAASMICLVLHLPMPPMFIMFIERVVLCIQTPTILSNFGMREPRAWELHSLLLVNPTRPDEASKCSYIFPSMWRNMGNVQAPKGKISHQLPPTGGDPEPSFCPDSQPSYLAQLWPFTSYKWLYMGLYIL